MEYIRSAVEETTEDDGCIFCRLPDEEPERVLARTHLAYVVLNKFPYNPGHLLVGAPPSRGRDRGPDG